VPYDSPSLLCIGTSYAVNAALKEAGYKVLEGSFGAPYPAENVDGGYVPLLVDTYLPAGWQECKVVVFNQVAEAQYSPSGYPTAPKRDGCIWVKQDSEIIDPRPAAMQRRQLDTCRMLKHGAVFVVLADHYHPQNLLLAREQSHTLLDQAPVKANLFSFAPDGIAERIHSTEISGQDVRVNPKGPLARFFEGRLPDVFFTAEFDKGMLVAEYAMLSSFGMPVSFVIRDQLIGKGAIYALPGFVNEADAITEFVDEVLPVLHPELFPSHSLVAWKANPAYALPEVKEVDSKIVAAEEAHLAALGDLRAERDKAVEGVQDLYDILAETGDSLVGAVLSVLSRIGFSNVQEMDSIADESAQARCEDFRLLDDTEKLVVEVKGIGGMPKDEELTTVGKYLAAAMKDLKTYEVLGLTIVNHLRHIPPPQREAHVVRPGLIGALEAQHVGVITTENLYRLYRRKSKMAWSDEQCRCILHRRGEIEPLPDEYEACGIVVNYFAKVGAVCVQLTGAVTVGDLIAVEAESDLHASTVSSLQVNDEAVQSADGGGVGIVCGLTKDQCKNGSRVFVVRQPKCNGSLQAAPRERP